MGQPGDESAQTKSILKKFPLGVGTWSWGDKGVWNYQGGEAEKEAQEAFNKSVECGVHLFDTAQLYGDGVSEQLVGRFVKELPAGTRDKLVIATKYCPMPWHFNARKQVVNSLRASLSRLEMEKVDLYQIHGPALSVRSVEHLADGLADAFELGLCKAVGVSNFNAHQLRRAHATLKKRSVPLESNQVEYSLLRTMPDENGLLSTCAELGVLVLAYSPLGMGRLTGKYSAANPAPASRYFSRVSPDKIEPLLQKMRDIGEARGKSVSQVALNWIMQKGAIPIPGARNAKQAQENAGALGWQLTPEETEELSELAMKGKNSFYWQHG